MPPPAVVHVWRKMQQHTCYVCANRKMRIQLSTWYQRAEKMQFSSSSLNQNSDTCVKKCWYHGFGCATRSFPIHVFKMCSSVKTALFDVTRQTAGCSVTLHFRTTLCGNKKSNLNIGFTPPPFPQLTTVLLKSYRAGGKGGKHGLKSILLITHKSALSASWTTPSA